MIIEDLHVRQRALDPTQSFIVQAPAGSGKTELLTQRYLVLLSHAKKAPEEIIAITFTRKAVAEMRARIMHALSFALEKEPEKNDYRHTTWLLATAVLKKDAALQWHLLRNPNRLRILTIDALSSFLCHQTPLLTQFGATPMLCENANPLYQLAAQKLLTDAITEKKWRASIEHLLLHLDNNAEKLQTLLTDLLNHRDQWLPHILHAYTNHDALRDKLNQHLQAIAQEKMCNAQQHIPAHLKQVLLLLATHVGQYFQENNPDHLLSSCAALSFAENPSVTQFSAWLAFANLLLTKEGAWRKTVTKETGFPAKDPQKSLMLGILTELTDCTAFQECLQDIQSLPPLLYSDVQWETISALTQLLPLLVAQLSLVFQEKEQIDFIELNLAAQRALGSEESPTDLALYLDYQIQHLLIDEFQDTSIVHFHLLEKIITGWQPHDGRTVFVVGDPMQSIYRFRNADVGLFLRAKQQGIGTVTLESLTLTMNFRSQKNLVSWFNHTFHTIFPAASDVTIGRVPYTTATAAREALDDHHAELHPIINGNDHDEAEFLAEKIQHTQQKNPQDTIALLVRARTQLIPLIQSLQKRAIAFQAVDIEPLIQRPEIQDVLSLTRALLHRADRIAWFAILRAPFCGLSLPDLEIIAHHAEKITVWETLLSIDQFKNLSADGLSRAQRMRYYLQAAFCKQSQLSLAAWIEGVWIALNGPACLSQSSEIEDVRAYFNLLSTLENTQHTFSITELQAACQKLFSNKKSSATNPVQILTIHKSKGLEFDHVFLPGLHRRPPAADEKLLRWLERVNASGGDDLLLAPIQSASHSSDAIYRYLKKIENQKQQVETTRLLYVAATRAKKSLQLSALFTDDDGIRPPSSGSFMEKLWPVYKTESEKWINTASHTQTENVSAKSIALSRIINTWNNQKDLLIPKPSHDPIHIQLSLHSKRARIIGTVIHDALQSIAEIGCYDDSGLTAHCISLGLLPHEINDAVNTVQIAVKKIISDKRARWILSNTHTQAKCEWALTHHKDNDVQHYVIDRSFVDSDQTRWIIDYKTSQPIDNESLHDFLQREKEAHQAQLEKYAEVISEWDNKNPIRLGLYFPLCTAWIEMDYKI